MGARRRWFSARVIVEIKLPRDNARSRKYDDRILVVHAASEKAAIRTAEKVTRADETSYRNAFGETVRWRFREVLEVSELLATELTSGTEVYSTFIDFKQLQALRRRGLAPWPAYQRAHPNADPRRVTIRQVVDWYERPERKRYALVVRARDAYVRAHPRKDPSTLTVRELLTWYEKHGSPGDRDPRRRSTVAAPSQTLYRELMAEPSLPSNARSVRDRDQPRRIVTG